MKHRTSYTPLRLAPRRPASPRCTTRRRCLNAPPAPLSASRRAAPLRLAAGVNVLRGRNAAPVSDGVEAGRVPTPRLRSEETLARGALLSTKRRVGLGYAKRTDATL